MSKGEYEVLQTLKSRKILPIDKKTFERVLRLTSGQIYDPLIQQLPDGTCTVKYTKRAGKDEIRFIFSNLNEKDFKWIVRKVKRKTKQGEKEMQEILNFDDLARRVLLIHLFFAWGVSDSRFVYRPYDMLYWLDRLGQKKGKMRDRVSSITHALALATVITKNEADEEIKITHLMSLIERGKSRNREFEVSLNEDALMPLWPGLMKQLKKQGKLSYVRYPVARLVYKPKQSKYVQNFVDWAVKQYGFANRSWPRKVETLLIEAMLMTPKEIKREKNTKIKLHWMLLDGLIEGKRDGVITGWDIPSTKKLSKSQWLKTTIKIYFPKQEKRPQLLQFLGAIKKTDVPDDVLVTEIADWLHDEKFGTRRSYKTTINMLKQTIEKLGKETVQKTFEWVTEDSNNPHPMRFWEEIEGDLKKQAKNELSTD